MQNQEPGNNLFCIYRDCEDLALFGDYCKAHQFQRAVAAEAQRDIAWLELREIRRLIEADESESTLDEVTRKVYRLSKDAHDAEQERDELARKLDQAQNREQMDRAVMTEASAKIDELRQEARDSASRVVTLSTQLEKAQRKIDALTTQLGQVMTA